MEGNYTKEPAPVENIDDCVVTHRVYGGRERSISCASWHLIRNTMPRTVNGKLLSLTDPDLQANSGGIRGVQTHATEFTMPWRDYKVDLTYYWKQGTQHITCKCTPTTSQMVIRASSAPIKDFEARNLISANLWRGGYEINPRRYTKRQVKYKGDITLENVLRIAKQIHHKTTSATFLMTVKQVLGTVITLGLTTEKKSTRFYLNRIEDGRITFIDESEILPYLDEDGMPWHCPNYNLARKTWYNLYPAKHTDEAQEADAADEPAEGDTAAESDTPAVRPEIDVREELVCFHWLQKICNKGDQCAFLHTMTRQ